VNLTNDRPFVAGNWKMNNTVPQALSLIEDILSRAGDFQGVEMVVIPPYTSLYSVREALEGTPLRLGAQNFFWEESGAYTGEISPAMLLDAGCAYVVLGHSERRQIFGDTDADVNRKLLAALRHNLVPILCLGETREERESGRTIDKIAGQLEKGLEGVPEEDLRRVVIAYEPIWAIGTGLTATPAQAQEVHAFIRERLEQKYGQEIASCAIILYGGSVNPANAFSLIKERDINGALVGGASLKAHSFVENAKEALKAYKEK
jgi:triosephosphate isomerase